MANNLVQNMKQMRIEGRGRGEEGGEGKTFGLEIMDYNHMCPLSANLASEAKAG